jgi:hypothetical protein
VAKSKPMKAASPLGPKRSAAQKFGKLTGMSVAPTGGQKTVKQVARPGSQLQKYTTKTAAGKGFTARPGGSQVKAPGGGTGTVARPGGAQPASPKK